MFWAAHALHWSYQLVFPWARAPGKLLNQLRGRDRSLQLLSVNQESPAGSSYQLDSIKSLPFVHTARRYYRLNVLVRSMDGYRQALTS